MANVCNVVSTARLSGNLNLQKISTNSSSSSIAAVIDYDPRRFNAMVIRIKNPKATGLLFNSGKIVCVGAKSVADNTRANEIFRGIVQKCGYPDTKLNNLRVVNVVGSGKVDTRLNITSLAKTHKKLVQYEPELFSGAKISFPDTRAIALVFTTGKIVFTGLKTEIEMRRFFKRVVFLLDMFKIDLK